MQNLEWRIMPDKLLVTLTENFGPGITICSPQPTEDESDAGAPVVVHFTKTNGLRFVLRHKLMNEDVRPSEDEGWDTYLRGTTVDCPEEVRSDPSELCFVPSVYALLYGSEIDAFAAVLSDEPPMHYIPSLADLGPPTYWLRLVSGLVTAELVNKKEDGLHLLLTPIFKRFIELDLPAFRTLCLGTPEKFFGYPARAIGRAHFEDTEMDVLEVTLS
jgi:hypothetical protein